MTATYRLPGGTIVTREQRTFRFAPDLLHNRGSFSGRVTGGTGRYSHAKGTVSGGGPGSERRTHWVVKFFFR